MGFHQWLMNLNAGRGILFRIKPKTHEEALEQVERELGKLLKGECKFRTKFEASGSLYMLDLLQEGKKKEHVANFTLVQLPGCCGVCVSTAAYVLPLFRGRGIGTRLNLLREDLARIDGYGLILCTDKLANDRQRAILKKNGWTDVHTFTNPRTTNQIAISVKGLK